jgi:hypothetical protein
VAGGCAVFGTHSTEFTAISFGSADIAA